MLNKCFFQGNLTSDVKLRTTTNNKEYAFFSLAVQRDFNKEQVDFIEFRAWGATAKFLEKEGKKGRRVLIKESSVVTYMDKEQKKYLFEVKQLDIDFEAKHTSGVSEEKDEEEQDTNGNTQKEDMPF